MFINNFSKLSRYTILDISTYLKKDFKFSSLIDPVFPWGNQKLLYSRFNVFLNHFKTLNDKNSPLYYIFGVLKLLNTCLFVNKGFFRKISEANIFDVADHLAQVAELIISIYTERNPNSRELRKMYQENKEIMGSFILLLQETIRILRKKLVFKDLLLRYDKEYENMNLFYSILRILIFLSKINPAFIFEECVIRIL